MWDCNGLWYRKLEEIMVGQKGVHLGGMLIVRLIRIGYYIGHYKGL